jgi:hypothetical protein
MQNIPRAVYFNKGICVAVETGGEIVEHDLMLPLLMPTEHYDFAGPLAGCIKGMSIVAVINTLYTEKKFFSTEELGNVSDTEKFNCVIDGLWTKE